MGTSDQTADFDQFVAVHEDKMQEVSKAEFDKMVEDNLFATGPYAEYESWSPFMLARRGWGQLKDGRNVYFALKKGHYEL